MNEYELLIPKLTINSTIVENVPADLYFLTEELGLSEERAQREIDTLRQSVAPLLRREKIRKQISAVADLQSLIGTMSDAATHTLDDTAMDILSIQKMEQSSYKSARMSLYEELHGEGSWAVAVDAAEKWFIARKNNEIRLPADVKGFQHVFSDIAQRGTSIADILEKH